MDSSSWRKGNNGDGDVKKISTTLGMGNLSLSIIPPGQSNGISRDLLRRFKGSGGESEILMIDKDEGIELNLGLSLGGRFGIDKSSGKLKRSSSIASCLPLVRDDNSGAAAATASSHTTGLVRTSSLPLEVEEDWRKRKEWQTLRRMEAKRRRSEKQRNNSKADKGGGGEGNGVTGNLNLEVRKEIEVHLRDRFEKGRNLAAGKGLRLGSSSVDSGGGIAEVDHMVKGKGRCIGNDGKVGFGNMGSQGSVESREVGFLGALDMSSETPPQGSKNDQEQSNPNVSTPSCSKSKEKMSITTGSQSGSPPKKSSTPITQGRKTTANSFKDMPCVFTMGDGPNGRRVDGILYRYGKGQEVRIMCVCHGSFHSPAEFIRHAGGTEVDHPLKHIVVNQNAASLL